MKRSRYFRAGICLVLSLLLTGCSYREYSKTALLPLTADTGMTKADSEESANWELQKIYQYDYTTSNNSGSASALSTTIGWSGKDTTLYTLNGASGEHVTVEKVDIRYGFHEVCADLGVLNYLTLKLSPDGRYVVYTLLTQENMLGIYLYSLANQSAVCILELPSADPYLTVDFIFSGDGNRIFFWYCINPSLSVNSWYNLMCFDGFYDLYNYFCKYFLDENPNLLCELRAYLIPDDTWLLLEKGQENPLVLPEEVLPLALQDRVWVNSDGSRLMILNRWLNTYLILAVDNDSIRVLQNEIPLNYYDFYMQDNASEERPSNENTSDDGFTAKKKANTQYDSLGIPYSAPFFSGITEHYAYGLFDDTAQFLQFDFPDDFTRPPVLYSGSERKLTVQNDFMNDLGASHLLLANSENYLLYLSDNAEGETSLYLYPVTLHSDTSLVILHTPTLLYQTTDSIVEITCSPDDRYLILRTQQLHDFTSRETDSDTDRIAGQASDDLLEIALSNGLDIDTLSHSGPVNADYEVTILEF